MFICLFFLVLFFVFLSSTDGLYIRQNMSERWATRDSSIYYIPRDMWPICTLLFSYSALDLQVCSL